MRILITGVHGFVGSNLVKALKDDHSIYGLDIISPIKEGIIKTYSWDEIDKDVIEEVDAIIHLAGKAHDTKNQSAADVYFKVNTGLTQKIFDWYLAHPTAKKFIQFSTVKSAADRVEGYFLTEECIPTPVGPYGESKIAAENYIIEKFAPEVMKRPFHNFTDADAVVDGKKVYIMRPCMIHGPGNKGNLNLLWGIARRGLPWPLAAFENKRSFTSIANICAAVEALCERGENGIYPIADDEMISTNRLIELIAETCGKRAKLWRVPKGVMRMVAKIGDVLHLPLNTERIVKLTEDSFVNNSHLKSQLGWKRMPIRAEEGMRRTLRSFLAQ